MFTLPVDDEVALALLEPRFAGRLYTLTDENRDHLAQWLPWVPTTYSVEDTRAFIRDVTLQFGRGEALTTAILYHGEIVGVVGFHEMNQEVKRAAIGYWLAQAYQGKGILTRACRALITYGFEALGLEKIIIEAATENSKSRAVAERLGYQLEGILRHHAKLSHGVVDHAVYGLMRADFKAM